MPLVLVPSIIVLVHRHKKREWKHQERLRAIEMGLPAAEPEQRLGGGAVIAIGAGVPVASVLAAWMTAVSVPHSTPDYLPIIAVAWGCTWMISTGALIASLILGIMLLRSRKPAEAADQFASAKPLCDPDAFDVVARRG
jgi:hypothetical protein